MCKTIFKLLSSLEKQAFFIKEARHFPIDTRNTWRYQLTTGLHSLGPCTVNCSVY